MTRSERRSWILLLSAMAAPVAGGQTAFTDEAVERGLSYVVTNDSDQFGAGVALVDLDGDGDPDCILTGRDDGAIGLYENNGEGVFIDRSADSGLGDSILHSGVAAADYDGDGDLDLYVTLLGETDRLYRNEGGFEFTDVTHAAGILAGGMGMGAAWGDYDNDGYLDLYVCNRTGYSADPTPNRLYHNLGDGTFEEVAAMLGVEDDDAPTLLCTWLDYDEDGDADLYLGTDKGSGPNEDNALFQNQGDGTFIEVTEETNTAANVDCMGIGVGDFDNDGGKDLYVTNVPLGNVLLMSNGDGPFVDRTIEAGVGSYEIGWGCAFFDYDHDMINDLYVCNMLAPNRFYRHQGSFPTEDIGPACGIADEETSFCMALGDVDMDGDVDLLVQSRDVNVRLYINRKGHLRSGAKLNVVGQGPNTHAVGATLKIHAGGVVQTREIHAGANYKSDNERVVHVGLAGEAMIDAIDVLWPGGTRRTIRNMPANETWNLYPPELLGDGNGDGQIDREDLLLAIQCYTGPGPGNLRPGCEIFDMDGDGDVDRDDLAAMGFPQDTTLIDFRIGTGTLLDGDVADLEESDDAYVHTRSGFGQTFAQLHNMTMEATAVTLVEDSATLNVLFESLIDQPSGVGHLSLRNWSTGEFERIATFDIGMDDGVVNVTDIDATRYVNSGGAIEIRARHVVMAPVFAFTFESFIDAVGLQVE